MKPRSTEIEIRDHKIFEAKSVGEKLQMWAATTSNGRYTLTLEKVAEPRSIDQNKLMWVWFGVIAQEWSERTGYPITPQIVHDSYCQLFIPIDTPKGVVGGSTKSLTKEQFSEFMNKIQADAASEYGITLLSGEDQYFSAWLQENKQYIK